MLFDFRKTNLFFLFYGLWLAFLTFVLLSRSRYDLFVLINHHRSSIANVVFTIFTELGSGFVLIPLGLYFLFKKQYIVIFNLVAILIINSLLVFWLKHFFYESRPLLAYGKDIVKTAPWVELYQKYSFPSGHTSFGFAIATYMSFLYKKNSIKIICFIVACFIGYSRVYLGEHFVFDVFGGSILGVLITCIYYFLTRLYLNNRVKKGKKIYLPKL